MWACSNYGEVSRYQGRWVRLLSTASVLYLVALGCFAQEGTFNHYPQAKEIESSESRTDDYLFTLGALKKINGQWRAEREQRLSGNLQRSTRELDSGHDVQQVFEFYRLQLLEKGARELFLCQARRCGSSNSWANNRFGIKQLYGLDQHQRYSAFALTDNGTTRYVALYGILRGNKRSYLQIDMIDSQQVVDIFSSREVIEKQLEVRGAFVLSDFEGALSDEQLKALVDVLRRQRLWQIAVVGIDRQPGRLQEQMDRSSEVANTIEQRLVDAGVAQDRLHSEGIGSLIPSSLSIPGERALIFTRVGL